MRPKRFYCSISSPESLLYLQKNFRDDKTREEDLLLFGQNRSPTTAKLSWIRIKSHCYSTLSLAQCNSLKVIRGHAFLAMDLAPSNSSCDNNDDISDQRPIIGLNLYESPQYNPICRFYCSAITVVRWLNHHRPRRHINQRSLPLQLLPRYVSCVISFLRFPSHLLSSSHSTVHPSVGSKHS